MPGQRGLAADLNGHVEIAYPPDGVVCTIVASLEDAEPVDPLVALRRSEALAETEPGAQPAA